MGSWGIGNLSTNYTNVTSNQSWDTRGLPPILVVVDYHNDRSKSSPEQPSRVGFLFYDQASSKYPQPSACWKSGGWLRGLTVVLEGRHGIAITVCCGLPHRNLLVFESGRK